MEYLRKLTHKALLTGQLRGASLGVEIPLVVTLPVEAISGSRAGAVSTVSTLL
jgi:hypothetical protein